MAVARETTNVADAPENVRPVDARFMTEDAVVLVSVTVLVPNTALRVMVPVDVKQGVVIEKLSESNVPAVTEMPELTEVFVVVMASCSV